MISGLFPVPFGAALPNLASTEETALGVSASSPVRDEFISVDPNPVVPALMCSGRDPLERSVPNAGEYALIIAIAGLVTLVVRRMQIASQLDRHPFGNLQGLNKLVSGSPSTNPVLRQRFVARMGDLFVDVLRQRIEEFEKGIKDETLTRHRIEARTVGYLRSMLETTDQLRRGLDHIQVRDQAPEYGMMLNTFLHDVDQALHILGRDYRAGRDPQAVKETNHGLLQEFAMMERRMQELRDSWNQ